MRRVDLGLTTSAGAEDATTFDPDAVEAIAALLVGGEDEAAISRALEEHRAEDLIAAAIRVYGDGAIVSTAFGAGGLCVLDIAQKINPLVASYYIDTGFAFPETEELIDVWVKERRLKLLRVLPALTPEEQAREHGGELWRSDPDRCCEIRKVEPNHRALEGKTLWIAALRRDESPSRKRTPILERITLPSGQSILKLAPIAAWTKREVWGYIDKHELPYNALHDRGYPSIGCTHCTRAVRDGESEREGRWAGVDKLECGLHIVQRKECC